MDRDADHRFLSRALELAALGRGHVEPNPLVGCVIVKAGRVIGEGCHQKFGGPHAEPNALSACSESPTGATAYVNLEPCCHTRKKTPPCVPRLIEAGIGRIVIGCLDPNPAVSGRGADALRAAGVEVTLGVCERDSKQLNAPFFAVQLLRRTYVTLKWAQSRSGQVGGANLRGLWISNETSRSAVHALRARCDAILVGISTVRIDDPLLTARGVAPGRPLERIVLNQDLSIPLDSQLVRSAHDSPVTVYCSTPATAETEGRERSLIARGVRVISIPLDQTGRIDLQAVVHDIGRRGATHLLVEPGPTLARSFLRANLADRIWVFRSPNDIPIAGAQTYAESVPFSESGHVDLAGDCLTEYLNPASPVFYSGETSVDFQMVSPQGR